MSSSCSSDSETDGEEVHCSQESHAGSTYSDMCDPTNDEHYIARSVPIADVLNSLHQYKLCEPGKTKVPSMSQWSSAFNDAVIRSNFKILRRLVSVDELCAHHFFMGEMKLVALNRKLQAIADYAVSATECIDTTEKELFCASDVNNSTVMVNKLANELSHYCYAFGEMDLKLKGTLPDLVGPSVSRVEQIISSQIMGGIYRWIVDLRQLILKLPLKLPKDCAEKKYEELAQNFFEIFGLHSTNGDSEQFALRYFDGGIEKKVVSHPDLLLRPILPGGRYCAVVEVKSMVVDPEFKHLLPKPVKACLKRSAEDSSEETSTPNESEGASLSPDKSSKRRRVSFASSDDSKEKTQESKSQPLFEESSLSPEVRKLLDTLFCQLFGGVMALDSCQYSFRKIMMGIGVVGFKVIFMSFQQLNDIEFHKVCETPGCRTDVYVTSPLSLLSATDRQKIIKILLLLATENLWN